MLANCIVYVLRRKCLLKYAIERDMEGTGRRAKRRKQLPDDIQENIRYLNLRGTLRSLSLSLSLSEEFAVDLAMDLSQDTLRNNSLQFSGY